MRDFKNCIWESKDPKYELKKIKEIEIQYSCVSFITVIPRRKMMDSSKDLL